jgi:hypothetical protein
VFLGLLDCVSDLIRLKRQRMLQDYLDGRANIEKEIVGTDE